jgi:hypothetical protein
VEENKERKVITEELKKVSLVDLFETKDLNERELSKVISKLQVVYDLYQLNGYSNIRINVDRGYYETFYYLTGDRLETAREYSKRIEKETKKIEKKKERRIRKIDPFKR